MSRRDVEVLLRVEGINNAFGVNALEDPSKLAATRNTPIVFTMVGRLLFKEG
jgi:hypothetical protein